MPQVYKKVGNALSLFFVPFIGYFLIYIKDATLKTVEQTLVYFATKTTSLGLF